MSMYDTTQAVRDAKAVETIKQFAAGNPAIVAVYIFGSFGTTFVHSESDVDVAILFHQSRIPDSLALMDMKFRLEQLTGAPVDVVCLNNASPIVSMQVLKKGKKILDKDGFLTNEFFVRTVNSYADLKIVRRPIEDRIFREAIHGRS